MKKKLLSVLIAFIFMFNLAGPVLADTTPTEVTATPVTTTQPATDPGITPDSTFYFLDKLAEKIVLIFTFSPEKKAEVLLEDANERLAEAQAMTDAGKDALAEKTAQDYASTIDAVQVQIIIAVNGGTVADAVYKNVYTPDITSVVYGLGKNKSSVVAMVYGLDLSKRHAGQVLLAVLAKAPEQARKGLLNAFKNVMKHELEKDGTITVVINGEQLTLDGSKVKKKEHQKPVAPEKKKDSLELEKDSKDKKDSRDKKDSKAGQQLQKGEHGKQGMNGKGNSDRGNSNNSEEDDD